MKKTQAIFLFLLLLLSSQRVDSYGTECHDASLAENITNSAEYDTDSIANRKIGDWCELMGSVLDVDDMDEEDWETTYDALQDLQEHPIDVNTATKEDLERIPFLDDSDVANILEYVYRNGKMLSLAELTMVYNLSAAKRTLLQRFLIVGEQKRETFPKLSNIAKYGKHVFIATGNIPFYDRKGDKNGYLGYKYRHGVRYDFSYGNYVRIGLLGAQDAGEPFFAGGNNVGYDFYSFYVDIRKLGRVKSITVGRYRLNMGMGLVVNNNLSFGKTVNTASLMHTGVTIRPHSSRSSYNYMQGAAATVALSRKVDVTAFASYKDIDATLNNDDGTISTILHTGYHRTTNEMAKKDNASQFAAGANITYSPGKLYFGASGVYTSLSRQLCPNVSQKYRRYYAFGKDFYNMSVDYGYRDGRFSLHGETATGSCHAWATVNALSWKLRQSFTLRVIQRFYSYKYSSLLGKSFSDGGSVQNESGLYVGMNWQPLRSVQVDYYTDFAYFPWAKYQAASSSHSLDNMLSVGMTSGKLRFLVRYRLKIREKDNAAKTALVNQTTHRGRMSMAYVADCWGVKAQLDATSVSYKDKSAGYMVSLCGDCSAIKHLKIYANAGYFHTDDYNSRVYAYERGMTYDVSFPSYYGEGIRYALMLSTDVVHNVIVAAKLSTTDYFDRSIIGTGLQQVAQSSMTDLLLQLKWKF